MFDDDDHGAHEIEVKTPDWVMALAALTIGAIILAAAMEYLQ